VDEITLPAQPYMKFPSMIKTSGKQAQRYQLMCSYYSALGADDRAYLLARAVQFFTPGIPQVYYVGLLAGENDIESLMRGEEPRSINRHSYTEEEIAKTVQKPMLQEMYRIMRFRNECPAFDGAVEIGQDNANGKLSIAWKNGAHTARLSADFATKDFTISSEDENGERIIYAQ
jgi:sucrose phosphorylase